MDDINSPEIEEFERDSKKVYVVIYSSSVGPEHDTRGEALEEWYEHFKTL